MVSNRRVIEFNVGGREAQGYIVEPSGSGGRPGLVVIHEWWGLNDHIKDIAGRFADKGFFVLAPDLYDGKIAKDPDEAGKLMQGLDQNRALETLSGAVDHLKSQERVNSEAIGVTGFCMGGTYALLLACHNKSIKAAAPFYGDVPSEDVLKNLSAPILFIGAENDPWINQDKMNRLKEALTKLNKEGEVKVYGGVGHAFFNDTRPEAYDREAAEDAWARVNQFFADEL
ncbi:MAG TPA: dienelactone hydrolase family protein [Blastocatellia bacterium]|nr:dienelactone hydrolase family protein [Blastocatellia bacterium]